MADITFDFTVAPVVFDLSFNTSSGGGGGSGTVTNFSVASPLSTALGVTNPTSTPTLAIQNASSPSTQFLKADGTWAVPAGGGSAGITLDQNPPTFTNTGLVTTSAGATGATTFVVAGDQTAIFTASTKVSFAIKATGQLYTVSSAVFSTNTTVTFAPVLLAADAFAIGASIYTVVGSSATTTSITDIGFGASLRTDVTGSAALVNLKPASASLLGGVKIGSGITVAADGTISAAAGGATKLSSLSDVSITEPGYVDSTLVISSFTSTVITTTAAVGSNLAVGDFIRGDNTTANSPLAKITAITGTSITVATTSGFGFTNAGKIYKASSTIIDQQLLSYDLANNKWIAKTPSAGGGGITYDENAPTFTTTALVTTSAGATGNTTFTVAGNQTATFTANTKISFQNSRILGQIYTVSSSTFSTNTTVTFSPALLAADAFAIGATIYSVTGGPVNQVTINEIAFPYGLTTTRNGSQLQVGYAGTSWTNPGDIGIGGQVLNAQSPKVTAPGQENIMDDKSEFIGQGYSAISNIAIFDASPPQILFAQTAYGNGVFVSLKFNSLNYYRLVDSGSSFYTYELFPGSFTGSSVAFGGGVFVVIVGTNYLYSSDGLAWTPSSFPFGVVYLTSANNLIFGTGGSNAIVSSNGINWTAVTGLDVYPRWVAYNGTRYMAISNTNGVSSVYISSDGTNWSLFTFSLPAGFTPSVFTGGAGKFWAGNGGNTMIFSDGISGFTSVNVGSLYGGSTFLWFDGSNIVMPSITPGSLLVTNDGVSFQTRATGFSLPINYGVYGSQFGIALYGAALNQFIRLYNRARVYVTYSDGSNPVSAPLGTYKCLGGPTWVRTA